MANERRGMVLEGTSVLDEKSWGVLSKKILDGKALPLPSNGLLRPPKKKNHV